MIKVQPLAGQRSFRRACWAVAALAVLSGAGACASGSASAPPPSATASASGSASSPASGSASAPASAVALDRTMPGPVLADWLHQEVVADYPAACRDMGEPASEASPSPAPTPGACPNSDTAPALKSFHGNFVADGLKPGSQFTVTAPASSGSTVTVNGTHVKVSGTNLTALMTAHSTGVKPGELKLSFVMSDIGGHWYVSDLNLDV